MSGEFSDFWAWLGLYFAVALFVVIVQLCRIADALWWIAKK